MSERSVFHSTLGHYKDHVSVAFWARSHHNSKMFFKMPSPPISSPFFQKPVLEKSRFLSIRGRGALCMNTLDMMSQLVSSCSQSYYQRKALEKQVCEYGVRVRTYVCVCVPIKASKDKSLHLSI